MAIVFATKSGNWSDPTVWNTGSLPDTVDDVYANGFNIDIDIDIEVASINRRPATGISGTGQFRVFNNVTMVCDVFGDNASTAGSLLINNTLGDGDVTLIGNVFALGGINNMAVRILNCKKFTFIGNGLGGSITSSRAFRNENGIPDSEIFLLGNLTGGTTTNTHGFDNASTNSIVYHTGTVTGGSNATAYGFFNQVGTAFIDLAIGGTVANGLRVTSSATAYLNVARGSDTALLLNGAVNDSTTANMIVKKVEPSAINAFGVRGNVKFSNDLDTTIEVIREDNSTLIFQDIANIPNVLPIESDVRENTSYNAGQLTGTLAVPDPSDVRKSVPTDDTVGTAELTAEDLLNELSSSSLPLAERLRNVSTVQTNGAQLAARK